MRDCVNRRGYSCTALNDLNCEGCSFYKTKEEADRENKRCLARLLSLPNGMELIDKYGMRKFYGVK